MALATVYALLAERTAWNSLPVRSPAWVVNGDLEGST